MDQKRIDQAKAIETNGMTTKQRLAMLVNLRQQFWDHLGVLEAELAPDGEEFSDKANDAVHDEIAQLAAALPSGDDVTDEHVQRVEQLAKQ